MHSMRIELKDNNKVLKDKVRNLALSCNIARIDGNEYFGEGNEQDFERFALFMIKLMNDKEFLENCSLWYWDEEEDGEHYIDNVLEEIKNRR